MVDYARRKPNILLSTYGEGRRGCGGGQRDRLTLQPLGLTPDRGQQRPRGGGITVLPRNLPMAPAQAESEPELEPEPGREPEPKPGLELGLKYELGLKTESDSSLESDSGESDSGEESDQESRQSHQNPDDEVTQRLGGGCVRDSWFERLQDCSSETPRSWCDKPSRRPRRRGPTDLSFQVTVQRGSRGLGLSLESAPGGRVRVRSVFPHQPAAMTGRVRSGDVLLAVNQMPLGGLGVQEVLNVLRVAGTEVVLTLTRPMEDGIMLSDSSDSDSTGSGFESRVTTLDTADSEPGSASRAGLRLPLDTENQGLFTVKLQKVNNTLGLSLRRTDDTVLGHTIRAKVREPAISDPRVRVGDKLLQVNGVDTTSLSHAEVVSLLRRCSERVTLTLYRDGAATPGSPGSPVCSRCTRLRPEAVQMLTGLAIRRERSAPPQHGPPGGRRSSRDEQVRRLSCGSRGSPRLGARRRIHATPADAEDPFSRLSGAAEDVIEGMSSEVLDQLSRLSSERETGRQPGDTAAAVEDDWPDSGDDSDAELHERHLRRVAEEATTDSALPGRNRQLYLSVQPQQRVKPGGVLKRISSEERLEGGAVSPEVGGQLGKWKGFTLDSATETGLESEGGADGAPGQSLNIQLRRGWSVRLGFSLHSTEGSHIVSQIHPDSVAERDGRLRVGDVITKVNDVPLQGMSSEEVIDLLRKTKGAIGLSVVRW